MKGYSVTVLDSPEEEYDEEIDAEEGGSDIRIDATKVKSRLLPVYQKLCRAKTPYIINFGGGGSAKSYSQAQFEVKKLITGKEKLLVIRKFATSLDDSVISQFLEVALPFWGLKEKVHYRYNKTKRILEFDNGSKVLFRGLDNPEKFKSIQGVTRVWIEEATEISANDFKILNDRMRGEPPPVITLTYNPISERHWLRSRFHSKNHPYSKGIDDDVTIIFSTYLQNPFVGEKYIKSMEYYKQYDPDHYRVYGLGKFGLIRPENPYFTAFKPIIHVAEEVPFDPYNPIVYLAWDFNINNSVLISQRAEGYISYLEAFHGGDDLAGMCRTLADKYGQYALYFTGDASGNNRSAYTDGNSSAWQLIEQYFRAAGAQHLYFERVPVKNPSTASSRHTCNSLLSHFGSRLQIDRHKCAGLIDDLEQVKATSDGSLDKLDANKNNYGHLSDCLRYDLMHFEFDTFVDITKEHHLAGHG